MDKKLIVGKVKISYTDVGSGPVIVFLHGWMASKNVYVGLVSILSKNYRCISIDIPGFGDSSYPGKISVKKLPILIHKAIRKLRIEKYYLVGNSMGGAISIMYANRYPDSITKIVLISPFVNFKQFSRMIYFLIKYAIPHVLDTKIISPVFKIVSSIINFSFRKSNTEDINKPTKKARIKRKAIYVFNIMYELSNLDLYSQLRKIRKDILLVYGNKDPLLSLKPLQPMFGVINNIHLAIFEDVRHYVFSFKPEDLAEKIDLFFKSDNIE